MNEDNKNEITQTKSSTNDKTATREVNYSGRKKVNKVAYVLFAFLLGDIGIHKFYAGKVGCGILYLIFSWTGIPWIIGIIEGIIGLTKESDQDGQIEV